jgi:hypothetical protein
LPQLAGAFQPKCRYRAAESAQIEELKQLAALRDQGILTEEEFSAKKAQILGL